MSVVPNELNLKSLGVEDFDKTLALRGLSPLISSSIEVIQMNLGYACNQACRHCHVSSSPDRSESMGKDVMEACISASIECGRPLIDLTGGAPEMNPYYRWFVAKCSMEGLRVRTRTNLTILVKEGYEDLPSFFAENKVEVVASLPYYLEDVTDRMRGKGVFKDSIEALRRLNALGYGKEGSGFALNIVYNPAGAFMPPRQSEVESDFKNELLKRYGVVFNSAFTITNMPIGRYYGFLESSGNLKSYMSRLASSYNRVAAGNVMCRKTLSVGFDGTLYDCDFNQMLKLKCSFGAPDTIKKFDKEALSVRRIVTGPHCYGCTSGAGSSCTGEVA